MPSFKVPCPSCENQVLIKDPKLIGTKVECPKCKYRFKVEEPAGGVPKEDAKAGKGKKAASASATEAAKAKKKRTAVAVVVGLVAVGVLAAVGFALLGGDKKPKGGSGNPQYVGNPNNTGLGGEDPKAPDDPGGEKKEPPKKPANPNKASQKEATNLLPNDTVAVCRLDVERVRLTPVSVMFDPTMLDMFRASFGFDPDEIALYLHAFAGAARDPFGVIRLKEPQGEAEVLGRMNLVRDKGTPLSPKAIKGRTVYAFKSNPFGKGVANTLAHRAVLADLYKPAEAAPPKADATFGVVFYDTQHLLVGEVARLEAFLKSLSADGYPPFKSDRGSASEGAGRAADALFLSIDPRLKKLLREMGAEADNPPMVVFAEELARGEYNPAQLKDDLQPIVEVLDPVLARTRYLGANLSEFTTKRLIGTVMLVMESDAVALGAVREHLAPGIETACLAATLFLKNPVEFRNETGGMLPVTPNPGGIGVGPEGGAGPGIGLPGGGRPGGYGPGGRPQPGAGPGPGPGPGTIPLGPGGGLPGVPGPGEGEGGGQPGVFPGTTPQPPPVAPSVVTLGHADREVTIGLDLNWTDETYRKVLAPRIVATANTLKGKMAVFASDLSYHGLAAAVPRMTAATGRFPPGTADRKLTDTSRMGLKYPPATRVSFFADLLPHAGRGSLAGTVNKDLPWYHEKNLAAAEAWAPELLVPSYPQAAWRATSEALSPGHVFGGTNYVAIAGVGLDAAYYTPNDPNTPDHAKKAGITGYDWGSKVDEVTDGLANTIYLMQTPPSGPPQPWLAGGGATVRGLDPKDPMRGWAHTFGTPDGKPGTFALMGDGTIRFIPADIKPDLLLAMATRAGGETFVADRIDKEAPVVNPVAKKPADEPKADPVPADPKAADPADGKKPEVAPAPKAK